MNLLSKDPAQLLELGASLEVAELWSDAATVYEVLLDLEPTSMTAVTKYLAVAFRLSDMDAAEQALLRIAAVLSKNPRGHAMVGHALLRIGRKPAAIDQFRRALACGGGVPAFTDLARALLPGPTWRAHLQWAQYLTRPARFVACGPDAADAVALARPPTHALAIDSAVRLGREPIDLAWIGGPRRADAMLDDVIGLEQRSVPSGAILFAGALPPAPEAADAERHEPFWQGEAWKLAAALVHWRPDLRVVTLPAQPAGITIVTRLDPGSSRLADERDAVARHMAGLDYDALAPAFAAQIAGASNDVGATAHALGLRSPP